MSKSTTTGGVGFFGLLTIAFIVLKLTNLITWSWVWVLAPIWIPIVCIIIFFVSVFLIVNRK